MSQLLVHSIDSSGPALAATYSTEQQDFSLYFPHLRAVIGREAATSKSLHPDLLSVLTIQSTGIQYYMVNLESVRDIIFCNRKCA